MKNALTVLVVIVGLVFVANGCRSSGTCKSPGCQTQSYSPSNYAPAYNQDYDRGVDSGSGSHRSPILQGSGSR